MKKIIGVSGIAAFALAIFFVNNTIKVDNGNLGLAELKGNWEMAEEFANIVNDISLNDINNAIKKYTESISWTYLGKKDMINEEDFLQPDKLLEVPIKN